MDHIKLSSYGSSVENFVLSGFTDMFSIVLVCWNTSYRYWDNVWFTGDTESSLCWFTKYHTTNKCTNCMSFIL